ncbi:MAG: hypothetical protein NZ480_02980 [Bdellovibrionaceae bacterium]|nr:hypothetical protein [Pseudobdellovibrionaceae bacterium]MDW8191153.1 hypothetical protein [Pseudobdellovibrionaceae bacterium]
MFPFQRLLGMLVFGIILSVTLWPNDGYASKEGGERREKFRPCAEIARECRKAGFKRKGEQGKRLRIDCVEKILNGESVDSVSVTPDLIEACKHMQKGIKEVRKEAEQKYKGN